MCIRTSKALCEFLAATGLILSGCATNRPESMSARTQPQQVRSQQALPATRDLTLNLEQVLKLTAEHSPRLAAARSAYRAAEARARQVGYLPNPELEIAVSGYNRDGAGADLSETEVSLGQIIELGGKRRRRSNTAQKELELISLDLASLELELLGQTRLRFAALAAAYRRVELSESAVKLAEKTNRAVHERVRAGKEPPSYMVKAEAELEMARIEQLDAETKIELARDQLAAMWGSDSAQFAAIKGSLDHISSSVPDLSTVSKKLRSTPRWQRWTLEKEKREAALASEKAAAIPDLEATIALQIFEEDGTDSIAFGIGLPLPLFDRNQGGIAAAHAEILQVEAEKNDARTALMLELSRTHKTLTLAHKRALALRSRVLPAMERAFEAAHEGFRQGKLDFLDMLDAQRSLIDAHGQLIEALAEYHVALVELDQLTASDIDISPEKKEGE